MSKLFTKQFTDKKTKEVYKYITTKSIDCIYPEGEYKVLGEVERNKVDKASSKGENVIILEENKSIIIQKRGYYPSEKYKTIGYLPVTEHDEFIEVKERKRNFIPLISCLLAILLIVGGWLIWNKNQGPDIDPGIKDYVADLKRPDNLDETRILIPGFGQWAKYESEEKLTATLFNPEDNPCYFQYTLRNAENEEVLYESKLIPPGKAITEFVLNKKLKAGEYKINISIKTYDLNDHTQAFNGGEMSTVLKVIKK